MTKRLSTSRSGIRTGPTDGFNLDRLCTRLIVQQSNQPEFDRLLRELLEGQGEISYARDMGYRHAVFLVRNAVKDNKHARHALEPQPSWPWFDHCGDPISGEAKEAINRVFREQVVDEIEKAIQYLHRCSDEERDLDLIHIPAGRMAYILLEHAIRATSGADRELLDCLEKLQLAAHGVVLEKGETLLRWLRGLEGGVGSSEAQMALAKRLSPIRAEVAACQGLDEFQLLVRITRAGWKVARESAPIEEISAFHVSGYAALLGPSPEPRCLLIFRARGGIQTLQSLLFVTLRSHDEDTLPELARRIAPLILAGAVLRRNFVVEHDLLVYCGPAIQDALQDISDTRKDEILAGVNQALDRLEILEVHFGLICGGVLPQFRPENDPCDLLALMEKHWEVVRRAVSALQELVSWPWRVPLEALGGSSLSDFLSRFELTRVEDHREVIGPALRRLKETLLSAQEYLQPRAVGIRDAAMFSLRLEEKAAELRQGRRPLGQVALSKPEREVLKELAMHRQSNISEGLDISAWLSFDTPNQATQLVHQLNRKITKVSGGALTRLLVSRGYKTRRYHLEQGIQCEIVPTQGSR